MSIKNFDDYVDVKEFAEFMKKELDNYVQEACNSSGGELPVDINGKVCKTQLSSLVVDFADFVREGF
jgi:hypothetical protein